MPQVSDTHVHGPGLRDLSRWGGGACIVHLITVLRLPGVLAWALRLGYLHERGSIRSLASQTSYSTLTVSYLTLLGAHAATLCALLDHF